MKFFSEGSLEALNKNAGNCYVYGLINPLNKKLFYIGQGVGNRVFDHEREDINNHSVDKEKHKIIKSIMDRGEEVEKVIFSYGLSKDEAIAAEAALINAHNYFQKDNQLSNEQTGHHNPYAFNVTTFEEENAAEELEDNNIKHRIVAIIINKLYERDMSPDELYDVVRGSWSLNLDNAKKCDYVFGIYNSLVKVVYKPTNWYKCTDKSRIPQRDKNNNKINNRVYFVDENYENNKDLDVNQRYYKGKSTKNISKLSYKKGRAKPERYLPAVIDNNTVPDKLYYKVPTELEDFIDESGIAEEMSYSIINKNGKECKKTIYLNECRISSGRKSRGKINYILDSKKMKEDGFIFYSYLEGIYIVGAVPSKYIRKLD